MAKTLITEELLGSSINDRCNFFINAPFIVHPTFGEVLELTTQAVRYPGDNKVILIVGPSGAGKTALFRLLVRRLIEEYSPKLKTGRIPVVEMTAPAPEDGGWKWREYNLWLLERAGEPEELIYSKPAEKEDPEARYSNEKRVKVNDHSIRAIKTLIRRSPVAVVIDEAQHITRRGSAEVYEDRLDRIKFIADISKVVHVLIGTYELLHFRDVSGQLSRRSIDIHFPRYAVFEHQQVNAVARDNFRAVLRNFENQLPLREASDLQQHWEFFYVRSVGNVGIVKRWLETGLRKTLEKKLERFTVDIIRESAPNERKAEKWIVEALEGEAQFAPDPERHARLRLLLGFPDSIEKRPNATSAKQTPAKNSKKKPVGIPDPVRYPTGQDAAVKVAR